jgi:hypothetical protein
LIIAATADPGPLPKLQPTAMDSKNPTFRNYLSKKLGVFNGQDATNGQFPYAVQLAIKRTDNTNYRCGGVLFAYNLVVTTGESLQIFF